MQPLRPSASPTWSRCPGYRRMAMPAYESAAANAVVREEGTAAHHAAHMLAIGEPLKAGDLAPNGVEIDADMMDAAGEYVAFNRRTMGASMCVEEHLQCAGIHPSCEGTVDAGGFDRSTYEIHVSDFKYGYRYVEPTTPQLVCYADGIAQKYGVDLSRAWVNLTIYQPRKWHRDGAFRTRRVHGSDLLKEIKILNAAALATEAPDAPCVINPGCGDCTGRFQCPTLRGAAFDALSLVGRAVPEGLPLAAQEGELRLLQHAQKMLGDYVSGLAMVVEHNLKAGGRGTHYNLVPAGPGRLKWRDDVTGRVSAIGDLAGVDVFAPQALRTPTQLKKLLGDDVINMYAERPPGGMELQPIDFDRYTKLLGKF